MRQQRSSKEIRSDNPNPDRELAAEILDTLHSIERKLYEEPKPIVVNATSAPMKPLKKG